MNRYCPTHGIYPLPTPRGMCPQCYRADNSRRNAKARANGSKSSYWEKVRQERLQMDGGLCTFKLPGCTGQAETVHLDPELGANHWLATLDNTRSACRRCHGKADAPRARVN
jgi:5-methylcytosine-specific restriction endonuclease McrA